MKTFVIGDIHGQHKALQGCLQASGFDHENDRLIALGDVCDRGPQVKECIDELLKIRHLVYIFGNHDAWALEWAIYGRTSEDWMKQGGEATVRSYGSASMPREHVLFLSRAPLYFEEGARLFVHGGFDVKRGVKDTPKDMFFWDRDLAFEAEKMSAILPDFRFRGYDEIFIGHTPVTVFHGAREPRRCCNVWMMDTGAGLGGVLTVMDVETKEFWQA